LPERDWATYDLGARPVAARIWPSLESTSSQMTSENLAVARIDQLADDLVAGLELPVLGPAIVRLIDDPVDVALKVLGSGWAPSIDSFVE